MNDDWVVITIRETWHRYGWRSLLLIPASMGMVLAGYVVLVVALVAGGAS